MEWQIAAIMALVILAILLSAVLVWYLNAGQGGIPGKEDRADAKRQGLAAVVASDDIAEKEFCHT